ncbi:alkaline phosphatase D family protein [Undibacterium seohonense]|uniref:Alkaline phosphatase D family protein n=1 Tax=Undibacterium seohonense TaxID=1344950 RepID=A0ABR6X2U8_9BURK|nr:alkaline phosphatase D family protein [Undibacterium seohonense]MBC3807247.1 alkaline phosphatase D family protein [Undibacterium seohonense]
MKTPNTRRQFIRNFAATTAAASTTLALSACGGAGIAPVYATFEHGIASGDPLSDRVIIWTRVTPSSNYDGRDFELTWQVASDDQFTKVVKSGSIVTGASRDFTAKVDVSGLSANTVYFYRFNFDSRLSPVGRTKTLPIGSVQQVKLAVVTCSNYPAGYFHVYAEVAKLTELDAVIHLGDYIYEYPRDGYASQDAASLNRLVEPKTEIVTLSDYRSRYAIYRGDADLQAVHAKHPFITVWDDHEFANDTWIGGAENHDPASEGPFSARRAAALQAYNEWMPIRLPDAAKNDRIYRSFDFGSLVALHMLDTRLIGRDKQLSYANYMGTNGAFDAVKFTTDMSNPARQLMGAEQTTWLQLQLAKSSATWQILGQQVLMARMNIPAPLVLGQISFSDYTTLLGKAQLAPAALTVAEKTILAQPAIPYNLDAWDGYVVARETVFATAKNLDKNLIALAGDTHNTWASDLSDLSGNAIGVEFGVTSVTSPGFEEVFAKEDPAKVAAGLEQIVGPLVYAETKSRGFMIVTATPTETRSEWRYVNTVKAKTYSVVSGKTLKVLPGKANRKLLAV